MDKENVKCKDCEFCRCWKGRKFGVFNYTRYEYYCENPETHKLRDKQGYPINNFIGYGDKTRENKLTLKTSKKWCPLKNTVKRYIHSDSLYLEDPNEKEE